MSKMRGFGILPAMTDADIERAKADIAATGDLLERALKLSGLVTTLFHLEEMRKELSDGSRT